MIDLTPLDIRKKRDDLRRSVRGYATREVDDYLDYVADQFGRLASENQALAGKLETQESQLEEYRRRERALNDALLAAQELREEARSQSEREVAVTLMEAEKRADAILMEAKQSLQLSRSRFEELRLKRGQFLDTLKKLLGRFDDYLSFEDKRFEAEPDSLNSQLADLRAASRDQRGETARAVGEPADEASAGGAVSRDTVASARRSYTASGQ